jgi:hypothetical protein
MRISERTDHQEFGVLFQFGTAFFSITARSLLVLLFFRVAEMANEDSSRCVSLDGTSRLRLRRRNVYYVQPLRHVFLCLAIAALPQRRAVFLNVET